MRNELKAARNKIRLKYKMRVLWEHYPGEDFEEVRGTR